MGLVYLPTWIVEFYCKCRLFLYQSHGSYGYGTWPHPPGLLGRKEALTAKWCLCPGSNKKKYGWVFQGKRRNLKYGEAFFLPWRMHGSTVYVPTKFVIQSNYSCIRYKHTIVPWMVWVLDAPISKNDQCFSWVFSSWWFQPIWKMCCARQIGSFPQGSGWKWNNII